MSHIKQLKNAKVSDNLEEASPRSRAATPSPKGPSPTVSPPKSRRLRKDSLENLDADPWASPALHKGHTHTVNNESTPGSNDITAVRPLVNGLKGSARTTSAFTTHSEDPTTTSSTLGGDDSAGDAPADGSGGGWGSYGNPSNDYPTAGQPESGADGFGSNGGDQGNPNGGALGRSVGGNRNVSRGVEETVTITTLPDKEGMFLFQHRNYEVKSARRASTVVRRYSDFVWLLDCLHKRYPFRQLPLLPPKRVAGKLTLPFAFHVWIQN